MYDTPLLIPCWTWCLLVVKLVEKVISKPKPHVKSAPLNDTPAKKNTTPKENKTSTDQIKEGKR